MPRLFPVALVCLLSACEGGYQPPLRSARARCERVLRSGEHHPKVSEAQASSPIERRITRQSLSFSALVRGDDQRVVFKDEERTGADRLMSPRLRASLRSLGLLVEQEWPGVTLRVTEAWDENSEHGESSLHYEGRAVDMTTSDRDTSKLGCLSGLAIRAGFDWVYYEGASHVHASVRP